MTPQAIRIRVVDSLPQPLEPSTLYCLRDSNGRLRLCMSDKNANMVLNAVSQDDINTGMENVTKKVETAFMLSVFSAFT